MVKNPSIEHATISEFTADGSAISQSSSQADHGSNSLLVNPANSEAGEGFYWTTPAMAGLAADRQVFLVARCTVRRASSSGDDAEIAIQNSSGTDLIVGDSITLSTTFQDLTVAYQIPPTGTTSTYRVIVRTKTLHNTDFYVDKIHIEERRGDSIIPAYVDGAQGLNYEWTGTANLSASKRRAGLSVIRGITVRNESTTLADIIYVGLDVDASATTGIPVAGGDTFTTNWPIDFREKVTVLAAQNTPALHGVIWGIHQG
jgi:hypothetical protein